MFSGSQRNRTERGKSKARVYDRRVPAWKPRVEPLEGRELLTTYFVATTGADVTGGGSQAAPFRSIQFAVTKAAATGDTIKVAAGSYVYNLAADNYSQDFRRTAVIAVFEKQLTILGGFTTADWNSYNPAVNQTILDGTDLHRGVFAIDLPQAPPTALTLAGFTVTRGLGGGYTTSSGVRAIDGTGGGMLVEGAGVSLRDVAFRANRAIGDNTNQGRGGAGAGGGLFLSSSSSATVGTLQNVTFADNLAQGGSGPVRGGFGQGGGLFTFQYTVNGEDLTFTNNRAIGGSTAGSGFAEGDLADGQGGGVAIHIGSVGNLRGVRASGNSAIGGAAPNGDAGGAFGGGVYAESARLTLTTSDVRSNTAQGGNGNNSGATGGGAGFGNGGGLMTFNSQTVVDRSLFLANLAQGGTGAVIKGSAGGGGVAFLSQAGVAASGSIVNSVIADNTAALGGGTQEQGGGGGGIWILGPPTTLVHSTIARNQMVGTNPTMPTMQGQGVLVLGGATATLSFNIIADHVNNLNAGNGFAAALSVQPGNTVNLNRNLFTSSNSKDTNANGLPSPAGTFNGLNTSVTPDPPTAGFLTPGAPNFDYRIGAGSAAVNAATGSGTTVDITGQIRQGTPDIGAYELGATTPLPRSPKTTIGMFDPSTATWFLRNDNSSGSPSITPFGYGAPGWIPVAGDWDGDGRTTIGMFDPSTATWFLRNDNSSGNPSIAPFRYGAPGWIPVAGDWDGNGVTTIGMFDPSTATWFLRNDNSAGPVSYAPFSFGGGNWKPVVGDWDGDGDTTVGVVDPNSTWYLRNENSGGAPSIAPFGYGAPGWRPVAGDWDGDGDTTVGIVDPSATWYLRNINSTGAPSYPPFGYGAGTWVPLAGDWNGPNGSSLTAASRQLGASPEAATLSSEGTGRLVEAANAGGTGGAAGRAARTGTTASDGSGSREKMDLLTAALNAWGYGLGQDALDAGQVDSSRLRGRARVRRLS
jgi:hypothetical protein